MTKNRILTSFVSLAFLGASAWAQETTGGWRRVTDPAPPEAAENQPLDEYGQRPGAPARTGSPDDQRYGAPDAPRYNVPPELTLAPGTFVTVRVDQPLSSDRNAAGDVFSATLVKPIVVDGVVVAARGQTVAGRVVEAVKAGRVQGTSRLALEVTDLTLVDGQQLRVKSQLVSYNGPTSNGRDATAVATTTGLGAAIGGAAEGGVGAGIGAGAGAAVGLIGVLLTRGHQTVIYPESVLTFRVDAPVTISTARSPQSFRSVDPREYERDSAPRMQARTMAPRPPYYGGYYGGYGPYPYGYPYPYPYLFGPSIGFYYGSGWGWGPRYYRGYGYRGGFRR